VWPVTGHEWAVELLDRGIQAGQLGHAYLLAGPARIGKTTLARAFTQVLCCSGDEPPCGNCRNCRLVQADRHPDVSLIAPDNDRIKISAIREMQHSVALSPVEGPYRICIIRQIDRATTSAANALLKTLEEPPPKVVLVLTADRLDIVPPTVISRCQVLLLRALSREQIMDALQARGVDREKARRVSRLALGKMGWAVTACQDQQVLAQRAQILDETLGMVRESYAGRFAWAEKLSKRPEQVSLVLDVLSSWWRDVLLLAAGSSTPIVNVDREDRLHEWAQRFTVEETQQVLRSITDTAWRLEHNANLRLALEVLTLDMPGEVKRI
jgi:DNA polymerase-3 subunit delta'